MCVDREYVIWIVLETRRGKNKKEKEQITKTPTYKVQDTMGVEAYQHIANCHSLTEDIVTDMSSWRERKPVKKTSS